MAKIVRVTWTDPSPTTNVDHLEIWRSVNGGASAQVGTDLALGVQTYDDDNGGTGFADSDVLDYSVRAYNSTGQYAEVTGQITISGAATPVLFSETFDGTTLDTTTNWTLVNPDPLESTYSQNNVLIQGVNFDGVGISGTNNYYHTSSAVWDPTDGDLCFIVDFQQQVAGEQDATSNYNVRVTDVVSGTNTCTIGFYSAPSGNPNNIRFIAKVNNVTQDAQVIHDFTTSMLTHKMFWNRTANTITYSYWNGASWSQLHQFTGVESTGAAPLFISTATGVFSGGDHTMHYDNIYITDSDVASQYPV
jgi:hypothetical protein